MRSFTSGRRLAAVAMVAALAATTIGASPASAATPANRAYITSVYKDLLDRANPTQDAGGIKYWADRLEGGTSRKDIVRALTYAPPQEYFGFQVDLYYNLYLERSADPGGFAYYKARFADGRKNQGDIVATLVGSTEYYSKAGGNLDAFVNRAYFDILGRQVDADGLQFYKVIAGRRGRGSVARILLKSPEHLRAEVTDAYQNLLERAPKEGELNYWIAQRRAGRAFETLDITLIASSEYYKKNAVG